MEATRAPGLSITVEKNPPEARLLQLGVKSWPKWGCPPGRFPLKFDAALTCYLVKGRVRAAVKGSRECVEWRPRRLPQGPQLHLGRRRRRRQALQLRPLLNYRAPCAHLPV
ncbi:uncharacterized protein C2845_PM16G11150 [Panicum miliaceum]|uniref:(S)-ureidoglycine aminohydrolase cupin domain-containing protein n=1 Tax=Panicum miliaceum TaxID=4540 RepID=A0A3L6PT90_PANMI|nr:uncharacterized protein C2845_PM16G11150 [Panicum miliaceum]